MHFFLIIFLNVPYGTIIESTCSAEYDGFLTSALGLSAVLCLTVNKFFGSRPATLPPQENRTHVACDEPLAFFVPF